MRSSTGSDSCISSGSLSRIKNERERKHTGFPALERWGELNQKHVQTTGRAIRWLPFFLTVDSNQCLSLQDLLNRLSNRGNTEATRRVGVTSEHILENPQKGGENTDISCRDDIRRL